MIPESEHLRIAVVTGAHALHGRLKILVVSDILNRFSAGIDVLLREKNGLNFKNCKITDFAPFKEKTCLVQIEGITDRTAAENLKGAEIFITREEAERTRNELLGDDEYYYYDIVGCDVYLDNTLYGKVTDIMEAGAGEVLLITDNKGKKQMLPFVESMVNTGQIKNNRIDITPVEGILDL